MKSRRTSPESAVLYDSRFYLSQAASSIQSARQVIPVLLGLVRPSSVVDVGCGVGTWLAVFRELGITNVLGIDGSHVDRTLLHIPSQLVLSANLSEPPHVQQRFDLAISLEVGEHLSAEAAPGFVGFLTKLSDCVM